MGQRLLTELSGQKASQAGFKVAGGGGGTEKQMPGGKDSVAKG